MDETESSCNKFKQDYDKYQQYWLKDPIQEFNQFLDEFEVDDYKQGEDEEEQTQNPLLKGCRAKIPPLDKFDENIMLLKGVL